MKQGFANLCRAACVALLCTSASAQEEGAATAAPVTPEHILMLMFADQGRAVGYQSMIMSIQLEAAQATLDKDAAILARNLELYETNAISETELEISQLKDAWNRLQLIVAQKNLETVAAQVSALMLIEDHFQGSSVPLDTLYAAYLKSWNAGCDKGPAEVRANKAWMAFAEKSLERALDLNARGILADKVVEQRKADLRIARANHDARASRLDRCREVFFPSLSDVAATGR